MRDDLLQVIKKSRKSELKDSANLLKRIDRRDLYKCVGETLISEELKGKINGSDIASWSTEGNLR